MSDLRTAAQQALEAMELVTDLTNHDDEIYDAITALKAALENEFNPDWDRIEPLQENLREHMAEIKRLRAQLADGDNVAPTEPVQEPVPAAWRYKDTARICDNSDGRMTAPPGWVPLYTAPPQRQPLSVTEFRALYDRHAAYQEEGPEVSGWWEFARAIERAHNITGESK